MDWLVEAKAVINDVKPYVSSIGIAEKQQSSNMRIFFDITVLEGKKLIVSMDSSGFCICEESGVPGDTTYETINALLDSNSARFREEFSKALISKVNLLDQCSTNEQNKHDPGRSSPI